MINKDSSKLLSQSSNSTNSFDKEFQLELISSQEYCHLAC